MPQSTMSDGEHGPESSATGGLASVMLLTTAQSAMAEAVDERLSRIGIYVDDLRLLITVGSDGTDRVTLASHMHAPQSQTLRHVRPLEKLGWIERTSGGDFCLTDSGRSRVDEATRLVDEVAERWLCERVSPEQWRHLQTHLVALTEPA